MSRTARRPLTLHVSALSDAEYSSFTSSLGELTSPTPGRNWEDVTLSVREARGWLRGRYGAGVDGAMIDQVCISLNDGDHGCSDGITDHIDFEEFLPRVGTTGYPDWWTVLRCA